MMNNSLPSIDGLQPTRFFLIVSVFLIVLLLSLVFAIVVGPTTLDLGKVFAGNDINRDWFKVASIRFPRAIAAMIVGGCLAGAGVIFQALIHNPLASPYILGVSAGGSLGAVCALALGIVHIIPFSFTGCMIAILLVFMVARTNGRLFADTLLLAGVIVNTFFSACIMFVTYMTGSDQTLRIMRWVIGGISDLYEWSTLGISFFLLLILTVVLCFSGRTLNLLAISDDTAERMGVKIQSIRIWLFVLASLLTAIAVSISGPIGFVGLIVPHILRLIIGVDHRLLIPVSILAGGSFLVIANTLAAVIWRIPLPVGMITAFLGGPFFIWLMKTREIRRSGYGN